MKRVEKNVSITFSPDFLFTIHIFSKNETKMKIKVYLEFKR